LTLAGSPCHADGFYMDKIDVTNAKFAECARATGYVTIPERTARSEDFPGAPPENLVAGGVVISPADHALPRNDQLQWWSYVKGANWRPPAVRRATFAGRRTIRRDNVTAQPTAKWTGQQYWGKAFPFGRPSRCLLRDRDAIFGNDFREPARGPDLCEVLSVPRSPW
jgi:hypothetical protein